MNIILFILASLFLFAIGYLFGKQNKDDTKMEIIQNESKEDWEQIAEKILW